MIAIFVQGSKDIVLIVVEWRELVGDNVELFNKTRRQLIQRVARTSKVSQGNAILLHNPPQDKGPRLRKIPPHKYRNVKRTAIDKERRNMVQSNNQRN
ncbi:hypothetical protein FMUND_14650 [Fusarium mundagurra]|uniref:Uncharacterized protein n=1 Tax=Fusarium mundagurra TaxID=1567541 RepID=A0A8H6D150_9HYPO|nr:hypothetical protein FMUND_14650 [Fusarium mundagurra]